MRWKNDVHAGPVERYDLGSDAFCLGAGRDVSAGALVLVLLSSRGKAPGISRRGVLGMEAGA